jgi:hypothetical protein
VAADAEVVQKVMPLKVASTTGTREGTASEALVRKLAARGVKARISGDKKPFRVRLDYYDTRQEAAARVAELKQRGIIGFVTDEPRTGGASPR